MNTTDRAQLYNQTFPDRPPLGFNDDWVNGAWGIGAYYKNPNKLHGAYPHGYLDRVHSMFPDAGNTLHVFSGGLTSEVAMNLHHKYTKRKLRGEVGYDLPIMELVDLKGPEEGRFPTWQGDVMKMPGSWEGRFDLILSDPPYNAKNAEKYGTKMPNRPAVMRELRRVAAPGANLVWLDTMWPMFRKEQWKIWGYIAVVRSTNHVVRLASFFKAV